MRFSCDMPVQNVADGDNANVVEVWMLPECEGDIDSRILVC